MSLRSHNFNCFSNYQNFFSFKYGKKVYFSYCTILEIWKRAKLVGAFGSQLSEEEEPVEGTVEEEKLQNDSVHAIEDEKTQNNSEEATEDEERQNESEVTENEQRQNESEEASEEGKQQNESEEDSGGSDSTLKLAKSDSGDDIGLTEEEAAIIIQARKLIEIGTSILKEVVVVVAVLSSLHSRL